jgi:esterase/lipase superfamily enzyme
LEFLAWEMVSFVTVLAILFCLVGFVFLYKRVFNGQTKIAIGYVKVSTTSCAALFLILGILVLGTSVVSKLTYVYMGPHELFPPSAIQPLPNNIDPTVSEPDKDFAVVKVFYGTDRKRTGSKLANLFYGKERGALETGLCEVSIPRDHRMGQLERPSIWRFQFREAPDKHIIVLNVTPQDARGFSQALNNELSQSSFRQAFVFIHGYNVTFSDAARRTAQLAYDLAFEGPPIFYSWPSQGSFAGYPADEATIEWTVPDLKKFLHYVTDVTDAQKIYLIAHSMGSRALTAAATSLSGFRNRYGELVLSEIILAAPDIDSGVFLNLAKELQTGEVYHRITLYASSRDEALIASRRFHGGFPRAGDSEPEPISIDGVQTIDASAVDTSLLGHSYFGDNRSVISDLFNLIHYGGPPRFGLEVVNRSPKNYWRFRP